MFKDRLFALLTVFVCIFLSGCASQGFFLNSITPENKPIFRKKVIPGMTANIVISFAEVTDEESFQNEVVRAFNQMLLDTTEKIYREEPLIEYIEITVNRMGGFAYYVNPTDGTEKFIIKCNLTIVASWQEKLPEGKNNRKPQNESPLQKITPPQKHDYPGLFRTVRGVFYKINHNTETLGQIDQFSTYKTTLF